MKASILCNETSNEDVDSTFVSVQWKGSCPQIVEGIQVCVSIYLHEQSMSKIPIDQFVLQQNLNFYFHQSLLADESSVDVRVRCKDHQPLDGLGAHKLVLAAASPDFLKTALSGKKSLYFYSEPDT